MKILSALIFAAAICSGSWQLNNPFVDGTPDPTPTMEVTYIGTVIPANPNVPVNVRGCPKIDPICTINMKLIYPNTLNVLSRSQETGWFLVEIPGVGQSWVHPDVVVFRGN